MTIMKKTILLAAAAFVILCMTACSSPEKRVRAAAEGFLKAYYAGDYDRAAGFCKPQLAEMVSRGTAAFDRIPGETAKKMKEAAMQTSFKIVSVNLDRETGKAVVGYELTVPDSARPIPKKLAFEIEGRTALVDGIE